MSEKSIQAFVTQYIKLRPTFKLLGEKIASIIVEVLDINNINYHAVSNRSKTIESFSKKIDNPKYSEPLEQLTDLAGIRIVAYVEDDVKQICKIIEGLFEIDKTNSLDKGKELGEDKVGYKSVHFIGELSEDRTILPEYERFKSLKFEIQVRTILQHSWAEIEHDKNYKFSGELPTEIKRRFRLLAGTLELADREFNQLSIEIDSYSKDVKEKTEKGEFNIPLNSTSLKQFLLTRFNSSFVEGTFNGSEYESQIIDELNTFGIDTIYDLNEIIPNNILTNLEKSNNKTNLLGLTRLILIIKDHEKYFEKSYRGDWKNFISTEKQFLEYYNIDVDDFKQIFD